MFAIQRPSRWSGAIVGVALLTLAIGSQAFAVPRNTTLAAAPTPVTLVLQGMHPNDVDYHLGTFTAPPPLCSSGTWQGNGRGGRVFTCADGSGTFTASFDGEQEHYTGGNGPWKITDGSGSYLKLRGQGTASNVLLSSDPITFTNTWQGVVDQDAVAPRVRVSAATATRVRGSRTNYQARVAFTAQDDQADNPVQYTLAVTDSLGREVAWHKGEAAGPAPVALKLAMKIRPPAEAKTVTVELAASDPVGNQQTIHRTIKLPPLPSTRKPARASTVAGRCKIVVKPVHGKPTKVRVCKKKPPAPKPKPPTHVFSDSLGPRGVALDSAGNIYVADEGAVRS